MIIISFLTTNEFKLVLQKRIFTYKHWYKRNNQTQSNMKIRRNPAEGTFKWGRCWCVSIWTVYGLRVLKIRRFLHYIDDIWQNSKKNQINNTYDQRAPEWVSMCWEVLCTNGTLHCIMWLSQFSWDGACAGTKYTSGKAIWKNNTPAATAARKWV